MDRNSWTITFGPWAMVDSLWTIIWLSVAFEPNRTSAHCWNHKNCSNTKIQKIIFLKQRNKIMISEINFDEFEPEVISFANEVPNSTYVRPRNLTSGNSAHFLLWFPSIFSLLVYTRDERTSVSDVCPCPFISGVYFFVVE